MTRNEILKAIASNKALAKQINEKEGINFTRVKTDILEMYLYQSVIVKENNDCRIQDNHICDSIKSAAMAFLLKLDQLGVLDELLDEIR